MKFRTLADKIDFVFRELENIGAPVPPGSRLDLMRREFIDDTGQVARVASPGDSGFRQALEGLRDFHLLAPILASLRRVEVAPGAIRIKDLLKDNVLPHIGPKSRGRDLQTELLVAATCVRARMRPVTLEEPDVCAGLGGESWRIAVKRVKELNRIDDDVRDAAGQIAKKGGLGVIFLDVSRALDPDDEQFVAPMARPTFNQLLGRAMATAIRPHEACVKARVHGKEIGLVYFFFSGLRHDPISGWNLVTMHMDMRTAKSCDLRLRYRAFRRAFSRGVDRLPD